MRNIAARTFDFIDAQRRSLSGQLISIRAKWRAFSASLAIFLSSSRAVQWRGFRRWCGCRNLRSRALDDANRFGEANEPRSDRRESSITLGSLWSRSIHRARNHPRLFVDRYRAERFLDRTIANSWHFPSPSPPRCAVSRATRTGPRPPRNRRLPLASAAITCMRAPCACVTTFASRRTPSGLCCRFPRSSLSLPAKTERRQRRAGRESAGRARSSETREGNPFVRILWALDWLLCAGLTSSPGLVFFLLLSRRRVRWK